MSGACVDNSCTGIGQGCPAGEFCVDHECVSDPCDAADCAESEYCVRECDEVGCSHRCEPLCDCRGDETCDEDGACVPDRCFGVECGSGQVCDPATGGCVDDDCASMSCNMWEVCFEGECLPDPCDLVECPPFFVCEIRAGTDGPVPFCTGDDTYWTPGGDCERLLATGDGGCHCQAGSGPAGLPEVLLLLAALGLWWRRRRVGAQGGDKEGRS